MPLLEISDVAHRFGGTQALAGVTLQVEAGEIRGLVGENGSGKSTLMRVLAGDLTPDSGQVRLGGEILRAGPRARLVAGVAVVGQDPCVCPELTVAENILLGELPGRRGVVRRARVYAEAQRRLAVCGISLDPRQRAGELTGQARTMAGLARALSRSPRVLALDETTAALSPREVDVLRRLIRDRQLAGAAVIFVSHRLQEVLASTDTVTVLRDGQVTATRNSAWTGADDLIRLMTGRTVQPHRRHPAPGRGNPVLQVSDLRAGRPGGPVSLTVHAGEIVAIAGQGGSGRTTLLEAIFGASPRTGHVSVSGRPVAGGSPRAAIAAGMGLCPEDRHAQGLALQQSVQANAGMLVTGSRPLFSLADPGGTARVMDVLGGRLSLKVPSPGRPAATLSGGNQQKLMLGRWLAHRPQVLLVDEPTRGVDAGTKREIHQLLDDLAQDGAAILMVSSDLPELLALADRCLVLAAGRITAELGHGATEGELARAMAARPGPAPDG